MLDVFSQSVFKASIYFAIFLILFSIFVIVVVLILKSKRIEHDKKKKVFLKDWRKIFLDSPENLKILPHTPQNYLLDFLRLWNHYQESLKGQDQKNLATIAYRLKIDTLALQWLKHLKNRKKLLAIITLGNLKEEKTWPSLVKFLKHKNMLLACMAMRSLVKINPEKSVKLLIEFLFSKRLIPDLFVKDLIKLLDPYLFVEAFVEKLNQISDERKIYFFGHLTDLPYEKYIAFVRNTLNTTTNKELICKSLKLLQDPRDLSYAKKHLKNDFWPIRLQAVKLIGRVGNRKEIFHLVKALSDGNWWVRYRSAQALVDYPNLNTFNMQEIKDFLKSQKSKNIFKLAQIEKKYL